MRNDIEDEDEDATICVDADGECRFCGRKCKRMVFRYEVAKHGYEKHGACSRPCLEILEAREFDIYRAWRERVEKELFTRKPRKGGRRVESK